MLVAAMAAGSAFAQTQEPSAAADTTQPAPTAAATPACQVLCAGQQVELEVTEFVSSERHKIGDRFTLRLATALTLDGAVILPAGTPGIGEVVHAQAARGGGKPGELLLAARFLELPDGPLALRAMKLAARGKDNLTASLATSIAAGPFGMFVHGGEVEIAVGTRAIAKLAQDLDPARAIHTPPVPADAAASAQETPRTDDAHDASLIKE